MMRHLLAVFWNLALLFELSTNPVHQEHAEANDTCALYWLTGASLIATIAWMLYERNRRMNAPLHQDLPKTTPQSVAVAPATAVPAERYVFVATNDPNIDLQPKGRGRG